ncbi:MAG: ATP-binding protein [Planctomycetaceae bacterium]|jgi:SpoVK/Ycf46/Vps4 family AAA+-type ATPase|nr:ATP-binding protein [Planctomycetaceae bacterium]
MIGKPINESGIPAGKQQEDISQGKEPEPAMTFIPRKPQYTLEQVILPEEVTAQVKNLLKLADPLFRKMLYEEWELRKIDPFGENTAFLFYGPPGTGKTMCVEAFANALGKQVIDVSYSQIESKYVGETGKNIVAAFEAAEKSGALLFFDEADSILGSRMSNVTQAADQAVNVTRAVMLKELDAFSGIVAFATNFAKNIDSAFVRRIDKHIEIPLPTNKARLVMFQKMISDKVPGKNNLDWDKLVTESEGFAGGDIKNAVVNSLVRVASEPKDRQLATTKVFVEEIGLVRKGRQNVGKSAPIVTERVIPLEQAKQEIKAKGYD